MNFEDIIFDDNHLHKNSPSTGTIKGEGIEEGHVLLLLKGKKKIWFGLTTDEADEDGRLPFEVHRLYYEDFEGEQPVVSDMITVTVVNPIIPPESTGPHDADPQPVVVP